MQNFAVHEETDRWTDRWSSLYGKSVSLTVRGLRFGQTHLLLCCLQEGGSVRDHAQASKLSIDGIPEFNWDYRWVTHGSVLSS